MNDQEKSVMLAKAMGWHVWDTPGAHLIFVPNEPEDIPVKNLYDHANMALAWRVLNWWVKQDTAEFVIFDEWWCDGIVMDLDPADAQRLWLDKIVELVEATE